MDVFLVPRGGGAATAGIRLLAKADPHKAEVKGMLRKLCAGDAKVCAGLHGGAAAADAFQSITYTQRNMAHWRLVIIDLTAYFRAMGVEQAREKLQALHGPACVLTYDALAHDVFVPMVQRLVNAGCVPVLLHDVRALQFAGKGQEQARRDADRDAHIARSAPAYPRVGYNAPPFAEPADGVEVPHWESVFSHRGRHFSRSLFTYLYGKLVDWLQASPRLLVFCDGMGAPAGTRDDPLHGRTPRVIVCAAPGEPVSTHELPTWRHWVGEVDQLWIVYFLWLGIGQRTLVQTNDTDTLPQALLLLLKLTSADAQTPVVPAYWCAPWGNCDEQELPRAGAEPPRDDPPTAVLDALRAYGLPAHPPVHGSAEMRRVVLVTELCVETRALSARGTVVHVPEQDAALVRAGAPVGSFLSAADYADVLPPPPPLLQQQPAHKRQSTDMSAPAAEEEAAAAGAPSPTKRQAGGGGVTQLVRVRIKDDAWESDKTPYAERVHIVSLYGALRTMLSRVSAPTGVDAMLGSLVGVLAMLRGNDYTNAIVQAVPMESMCGDFMQLLATNTWERYVGTRALVHVCPRTHTWRVNADAVLRFLTYTYTVRRLKKNVGLLRQLERCNGSEEAAAVRSLWADMHVTAQHAMANRAAWWPAPWRVAEVEASRLDVALAVAQGPLLAMDTHRQVLPRIPDPLAHGWAVVGRDGCRRVQVASRDKHTPDGKHMPGFDGRVVTLGVAATAAAAAAAAAAPGTQWDIHTLVMRAESAAPTP